VEIEKTLSIAAPMDRVWNLLLDPTIMANCVPGVHSVQAISDTEYVCDIKVKISFISANFKFKNTILETRPPDYLCWEGTGADSSVASSVKQTGEMFLTPQPDGTTGLRVKVKADVFGRLGSFGLSVMKTKADRMWEEFGANVAAVLRLPAAATAGHPTAVKKDLPVSVSARPSEQTVGISHDTARPAKSKWWKRLFNEPGQAPDSIPALRLPADIYVEIQRPGEVIRVLWPASAAPEVAAWLKSILPEKRE
jgi:carbon monoxide dehydrogenase subunit G